MRNPSKWLSVCQCTCRRQWCHCEDPGVFLLRTIIEGLKILHFEIWWQIKKVFELNTARQNQDLRACPSTTASAVRRRNFGELDHTQRAAEGGCETSVTFSDEWWVPWHTLPHCDKILFLKVTAHPPVFSWHLGKAWVGKTLAWVQTACHGGSNPINVWLCFCATAWLTQIWVCVRPTWGKNSNTLAPQ